MLIQADARYIPLADKSCQTCITSPPYYGLRSYDLEPSIFGGDAECEHVWGNELPEHHPGQVAQSNTGEKHSGAAAKGQTVGSGSFCSLCNAWRGNLGLEPTPELFIQHLVEIFREVKRVLRDDGTLWIVIGDSYAGSGGDHAKHHRRTKVTLERNESDKGRQKILCTGGLKPKDLIGIPWMLAFALRADGWYLRSDIIWAKKNCMPESVQDRPTKSHEYLFLLAKSKRYFYEMEAIKEASKDPESYTGRRKRNAGQMDGAEPDNYKFHGSVQEDGTLRHGQTYPTRNRRTVWATSTYPYKGAHFAAYPPALIEPCILAGTSAKGACPICGAGWKRVMKKPNMTNRPIRKNDSKMNTNAVHLSNNWQGYPKSAGQEYQDWRNVNPDQFIGWHPTCSCYDGAIAEFGAGPYNHDEQRLFEYHLIDRVGITPCLVLDPFAGSGTTGMVAIKHGRDFVGLDLSKKYLHELAQKRLDGVQVTLL